MKKIKLYNVRVRSGYTQKELAEYLSIDASNYGRKENGIIRITQKEWEKLAKRFGVSIADIYEPDDELENESLIQKKETIKELHEIDKKINVKLEEIIVKLKKKIAQLNEALKNKKEE